MAKVKPNVVHTFWVLTVVPLFLPSTAFSLYEFWLSFTSCPIFGSFPFSTQQSHRTSGHHDNICIINGDNESLILKGFFSFFPCKTWNQKGAKWGNFSKLFSTHSFFLFTCFIPKTIQNSWGIKKSWYKPFCQSLLLLQNVSFVSWHLSHCN